MTDSEIVKSAILNTLEYLKLHEPKCICEQCPFGYKFDKELIFECKQYQEEIKKNIIFGNQKYYIGRKN